MATIFGVCQLTVDSEAFGVFSTRGCAFAVALRSKGGSRRVRTAVRPASVYDTPRANVEKAYPEG
jgi:hypothetical protein